MGLIRALLATEVALAVAPTIGRLARAVLRPEALHRSPCVKQRAVYREVIARQKPLHLRQRQQSGQEIVRHIGLEQPVPVLREYRCVPHVIVDRQPDEPAEQKIVVDLFHQLPLRAYREERLQQRCPQQVFGRDRGTPGMGIKLLEAPRQSRQHLIHQRPNGPQRMVRRDPLLQPDIRKKPLRSSLLAAHSKSPPSLLNNGITIGSCRRESFSAAC